MFPLQKTFLAANEEIALIVNYGSIPNSVSFDSPSRNDPFSFPLLFIGSSPFWSDVPGSSEVEVPWSLVS